MQHEEFIKGVRELVLAKRSLKDEVRARVEHAKLTYGAGSKSKRGICYYDAWRKDEQSHAFIEVCAMGEQSVIQLVGTTIHELAHAAAGSGAGHGLAWKEQCQALGLISASAAGQAYAQEHFDSELWAEVVKLGSPQDGNPSHSSIGAGLPFLTPAGVQVGGPCPLGFGTRGGTSRGQGSGSRMRLYHCSCEPVIKVRCASDELDATCNLCQGKFQLQPRKQERV